MTGLTGVIDKIVSCITLCTATCVAFNTLRSIIAHITGAIDQLIVSSNALSADVVRTGLTSSSTISNNTSSIADNKTRVTHCALLLIGVVAGGAMRIIAEEALSVVVGIHIIRV